MSSISYQTILSISGNSGNGDENKTRAIEYFANNRSETRLVLPGDWTVKLTRSVTFNRRVELVGPPTALGGDRPKFKITGSLTLGLDMRGGGLVEEVSFATDAAAPSARTTLRCYNATTLRDCTFNVGKLNLGVHHYGNSLRAERLSFSDGVQGKCIRLSNNGGSFNNSVICNNQFHLNKTTRAVEVDGSISCKGLMYRNNIIDIGSQMLRVSNGGLENSIIKGNTWYGTSSNSDGWGTEGVIQFKRGLINNVTIAGNSFTGGIYSSSSPLPTRFILFSGEINNSSNAIVEGNSFYRCKSGQKSVKVRRGTIQVRGNYIYNDSSSYRGNNGAEGQVSYNAG